MRILLAEDERSIRLTLIDDLEDAGHDVTGAEDGHEAVTALEAGSYDVVITDIRMPGRDGLEILKYVREHAPDTFVIMITGVPTYELAIQCIKTGAYDFIPKPFNHEEVLARLDKLEELIKLRDENRQLKSERDKAVQFENLVGRSPRMQEIFDEIRALADADFPILIRGESGTGKELFARAIHHHSPRRKKPMITAALQAGNINLIESDLFGHTKGAYTGAHSEREGKFVQADGGTLFLDDIDDMPVEIQAKLLRAIQFGEIEPLGWKKPEPLKVDVRVIGATKVNLDDLIEEGKFREDLYYRINTLEIEVPPLRQRPEDIPLLVHHFLQREVGRPNLTINDDALMAMTQHPWPGNVRELEGAVRVALARAGQSDEITRDHVLRSLKRTPQFKVDDPDTGMPLVTLGEAVEAAERSHIKRVLKFTENNTTKGAKILGISRKNLWEKRKKYQLDS
jgi:DNA-binding NtrC family response regulator